jgi:hypothetical protein
MAPSSKRSVLTVRALFQPGGQRGRLQLERHGDVRAAVALRHERAYGAGEIVDGRQAASVGDVLAGGGREQRMDGGRFAVGDRIADHAVLVDVAVCVHHAVNHLPRAARPSAFLRA